jgi:hypothetical protein
MLGVARAIFHEPFADFSAPLPARPREGMCRTASWPLPRTRLARKIHHEVAETVYGC